VGERAALDHGPSSPRILEDLRGNGEVVSRKTVAKIMRDNNIRGISPRPWHPVITGSSDLVGAWPLATPRVSVTE